MMRWIGTILLALGMVFVLANSAEADTITLKSGVTIEGRVLFQDENTVRVDIGGRERSYPATSVAKVEENDRTGHFDAERAVAEAEARLAKIERETGLTAQQRNEIKDLMWSLQSTDEAVHVQAKSAIIKFHEDLSLLKYFEWWLPGLSPRFVPGVLEILGEIDPARAAQIAPSHVHDLDARSRAMALTILSNTASAETTKLLGRGMVDDAYEVRIAAAKGLAQLKIKEATPLLIANFDSPEPHLAAIIRTSLRDLWSTESRPIDFETKAEWEEHWTKRKQDVGEPMIEIALMPLVEPGQVYEDE